MTKPAHWGAIFDWDGVVIDSSALHEESWERLAEEVSRVLPADHFKRGFGMKNEVIIPQLLQWTEDSDEIRRLSLRKEALYREVAQDRGLVALPGVERWLQRLAEAGVPCVIGSSTHRENIELALGQIGLIGYFSAIVSSEDVTHGKPHPDVFLKAAEKIDRAPAQCVVFEDAHVGIQAARRAGMRVVAVATTNPIDALTEADRAVHQLDELSVEELARWFTT